MGQFRIIYKYPSYESLTSGSWWNIDDEELAEFLLGNAAMDGALYDIEVRYV